MLDSVVKKLQELNQLQLDDIGEWPKSAQWLLITLLSVGLAVGAYFLLIKDQQQQLQRLVDKEQSLRHEFARQQSRAANLPHYRAQFEGRQSLFDSMLLQLPDQTEVADLLTDVSQAGLAVGLEFVLFQPQTEDAQAFYAELPIKLRVLGHYHQFGEFVSSLAALPRIVTLHNIMVKPQSSAKGQNDLLLMDATAKTYRYLDKEGG